MPLALVAGPKQSVSELPLTRLANMVGLVRAKRGGLAEASATLGWARRLGEDYNYLLCGPAHDNRLYRRGATGPPLRRGSHNAGNGLEPVSLGVLPHRAQSL
jgi:hypothetical protein